MTDPWGDEQPPADTGAPTPLPPRLARLAEVQATGVAVPDRDPYLPGAEDLPEVQLLMREGWRPLHDAPLYCLLPAAWPAEHRTWVPDRLPKVGTTGTTDTYAGDIVALPDEQDWPEEQLVEARALGLPDPPAGRIWLLRSPWPRIPVAAIYQLLWSVVEHTPTRDEIADVYRAATDVLTWDENRALDACPVATRELLDAWADAGRVGEAAAEVIERRIQPADLDEALRLTEVDEPTLLDWLSSLDTGLDDDAITFIRRWRESGLPGNPPPRADRYIDWNLDELKVWLEAGFDPYAASRLQLAGLATALRWREAGFDEADTYELLRSDPALTPEEARAFDGAGAARGRRREWIYYGFTASRAADWAATGLTPSEARLWRACGKEPGDVEPGRRVPAELVAGRRSIMVSRAPDGEISYPEWDDLPDPPGTRGRRARRRARDDDPWINSD